MTLDALLIIKAIHIIFVVSYFAGLFYIVRLLIYHTEAQGTADEKVLSHQFIIMENKLWKIIIVPAGIIMAITGVTMLLSSNYLIKEPWMHIKLLFVFILLVYHFWVWKTLKQMQKGVFRYSSLQLRMSNEVATLILFVVVFAVILKSLFLTLWYWVLISFVLLGGLIFGVVKLTNKGK